MAQRPSLFFWGNTMKTHRSIFLVCTMLWMPAGVNAAFEDCSRALHEEIEAATKLVETIAAQGDLEAARYRDAFLSATPKQGKLSICSLKTWQDMQGSVQGTTAAMSEEEVTRYLQTALQILLSELPTGNLDSTTPRYTESLSFSRAEAERILNDYFSPTWNMKGRFAAAAIGYLHQNSIRFFDARDVAISMLWSRQGEPHYYGEQVGDLTLCAESLAIDRRLDTYQSQAAKTLVGISPSHAGWKSKLTDIGRNVAASNTGYVSPSSPAEEQVFRVLASVINSVTHKIRSNPQVLNTFATRYWIAHRNYYLPEGEPTAESVLKASYAAITSILTPKKCQTFTHDLATEYPFYGEMHNVLSDDAKKYLVTLYILSHYPKLPSNAQDIKPYIAPLHSLHDWRKDSAFFWNPNVVAYNIATCATSQDFQNHFIPTGEQPSIASVVQAALTFAQKNRGKLRVTEAKRLLPTEVDLAALNDDGITILRTFAIVKQYSASEKSIFHWILAKAGRDFFDSHCTQLLAHCLLKNTIEIPSESNKEYGSQIHTLHGNNYVRSYAAWVPLIGGMLEPTPQHNVARDILKKAATADIEAAPASASTDGLSPITDNEPTAMQALPSFEAHGGAGTEEGSDQEEKRDQETEEGETLVVAEPAGEVVAAMKSPMPCSTAESLAVPPMHPALPVSPPGAEEIRAESPLFADVADSTGADKTNGTAYTSFSKQPNVQRRARAAIKKRAADKKNAARTSAAIQIQHWVRRIQRKHSARPESRESQAKAEAPHPADEAMADAADDATRLTKMEEEIAANAKAAAKISADAIEAEAKRKKNAATKVQQTWRGLVGRRSAQKLKVDQAAARAAAEAEAAAKLSAAAAEAQRLADEAYTAEMAILQRVADEARRAEEAAPEAYRQAQARLAAENAAKAAAAEQAKILLERSHMETEEKASTNYERAVQLAQKKKAEAEKRAQQKAQLEAARIERLAREEAAREMRQSAIAARSAHMTTPAPRIGTMPDTSQEDAAARERERLAELKDQETKQENANKAATNIQKSKTALYAGSTAGLAGTAWLVAHLAQGQNAKLTDQFFRRLLSGRYRKRLKADAKVNQKAITKAGIQTIIASVLAAGGAAAAATSAYSGN